MEGGPGRIHALHPERMTGFEPANLLLGKQALYQLSYIRETTYPDHHGLPRSAWTFLEFPDRCSGDRPLGALCNEERMDGLEPTTVCLEGRRSTN